MVYSNYFRIPCFVFRIFAHLNLFRISDFELRISKNLTLLLLFSLYSVSSHAFNLQDAHEDYLRGNYQSALAKAKELTPTNENLYFLALVNIKIENYPGARQILLRLLENKNDADLYESALLKVADTYFLEKDLVKAKSLYKDIEEKFPNFSCLPTVYLRLAQIAAQSGQWEEKNKYLNLLKDKFPQSPELKLAQPLERQGDFFTVQVGAFGTQKNAMVLEEELKKKGYPSYGETDPRADCTLYKVRVGKYNSRKEAEVAAKELLAQDYPARVYP